jgi:hypothetical protein
MEQFYEKSERDTLADELKKLSLKDLMSFIDFMILQYYETYLEVEPIFNKELKNRLLSTFVDTELENGQL